MEESTYKGRRGVIREIKTLNTEQAIRIEKLIGLSPLGRKEIFITEETWDKHGGEITEIQMDEAFT